MATKTFCDRCGKEVPEHYSCGVDTGMKINGSTIHFTYYTVGMGGKPDLCLTCFAGVADRFARNIFHDGKQKD